MNKYLVTGGAGVIGSFLVKKLAENNEIVVLDNLSSGNVKNLGNLIKERKVEFIKGDITNHEDVEKSLTDVDSVFHLAANADVRFRADRSTDLDLKINTIGTSTLLESMRKRDIKSIVFSSTSSVYGRASVIPTPENYGPLFPESLYGGSKLAAEAHISAFSSLFGIKSTIFRFANIVAPISRSIGKNVVPDFVDKLNQTPEKLLILGNGHQRKSYLFVEDCIEGILFLSEKQKGGVEVFNLGTEDAITVNEIADIVIEEMNLTSVKKIYTGGEIGWKGDVPFTYLDIKKAIGLGWKPKHSSTQSIRMSARGLIHYEV